MLAPPRLADERAWELLKAARIPVVPHFFVKRETDLEPALRKTGYPAFLKVSSPAVARKTEAGGIRKAADLPQAQQAFGELMKMKGAESVLVQKQLQGAEVIIGAKADPQFGHIVSMGLGGVYVEILKDVAFRVAPVTPEDALAMIKELRGFEILSGARGQPAVKLDSLIDVLVKVSRLAVSEKIKEMDINPLFCTAEGCWAADVRVVK